MPQTMTTEPNGSRIFYTAVPPLMFMYKNILSSSNFWLTECAAVFAAFYKKGGVKKNMISNREHKSLRGLFSSLTPPGFCNFPLIYVTFSTYLSFRHFNIVFFCLFLFHLVDLTPLPLCAFFLSLGVGLLAFHALFVYLLHCFQL